MSFNAKNIRRAIIDLLIGDSGSVRKLTPGKFKFGAFDGLSDTALQSKTIQGGNWFDVRFGSIRQHSASSSSSRGSRRIVTLEIVIPVWTGTATTVQEDDRIQVLGDIASDCESAVQALHYAGNLAEDANGNDTNIASGLLVGPSGEGTPEWRLLTEDWKAQRITSEITASAVIAIQQAVA